MGAITAEAYLLWYVNRLVDNNHLRVSRAELTCTIGKILKDEETVGSYKIEEKGYVVCMVNKVRSDHHGQIPSLMD
jgi:hypothetical protein